MLDKLTERLDFHGNALMLRAERQRAIASNIANADTPGYVARDFNFGDALREATGQGTGATFSMAERAIQRQQSTSDPRHIPLPAATTGMGSGSAMGYTVQTQPSMDNNTVDLDRERAAFADNAVRYEATLRFINGNARTMLSAIQGQ